MSKWKEIIGQIRGKKEQMLILFLVGLLLFVIAIPTSNKKEHVEKIDTRQVLSDVDEGTYVSNMELRLEQVLEKVQGVGNASVMITISESSEKIVEKDEETSVQSNEDNGKKNTSTERRVASIYSGESGEETPYVKKEISPRIEGVLVVAEGGDNPVVIESVTSAIQALFGIESHKIKVMKHN